MPRRRFHTDDPKTISAQMAVAKICRDAKVDFTTIALALGISRGSVHNRLTRANEVLEPRQLRVAT